MLSKSREFKHGNVAAQSVGGHAHNIVSTNLKKSSILSYETSEISLDTTISIPRINSQNNAESFDLTTGINSDSPEIIALSNFIPVYDKARQLNEFGSYLRNKQDAYLIRASSNLSNLLSNPDSTLISFNAAAQSNAENIVNFCENNARGIEDLLIHLELIRKKMDFRYPIDKAVLKLAGIAPPDIILNDKNSPNFFPQASISSIEEILNETNDVIKHWTPTKLWLQSCLELKEILANGMIKSFLADGGVLGVDATNYQYYDAYTITSPRSSLVKKFNFSENQISSYALRGLITGDPVGLRPIILSISSLFSSDGAGASIFNEKVFFENANIEESIAKLSHILCKEYVYSTRMRTDVLSDYGYPFVLGGKNAGIWDHLIGQVGSDITDISPIPLGGGKSLTSLAQSIEPDGVEVLSFEDRYINDNVGTVRPDAIIVPGTLYYLESSINFNGGNFDFSRLNRYIAKLNSSINMLKMVRDDLRFLPVEAYSSVNNKVLNKSGEGSSPTGFYSNAASAILNSNKNHKRETIKNALSNPISLIRHIEQKVLNGSGLLRRSGGPKLWTNKNFFDLEQDVSALLISLAVEKDDAELQSLLFLHQIYSHASSMQLADEYNSMSLSFSSDSLVKSKLVELILERIKAILSLAPIDKMIKASDEFKLSMSVVKDALMSQKNSSNLRMLNSIGALIYEFDENFDSNDSVSRTNGRFFLERIIRNTTIDKTNRPVSSRSSVEQLDRMSSYSGVEKTAYLVSIFKLCCLLVHTANPERLVGINKPTLQNQASDTITIRKIRNSVIGTFLSAEETKRGISNFSLLEKDVEGNVSFTASSYNNASAISAINKQTKKIKVFELPNSMQKGVKFFDLKNLSKKTVSNNQTLKLTVLYYDDIIVKTENLLADYENKIHKSVDRFYCFLYTLKDEFSKLKNNLQPNKAKSYGRSLFDFSNLIQNPNLVRSLMTEQQLLLIKSKMEDYTTRLRLESYTSPLRESTPYFLNLSSKDNLENFLPIEDVHLVSWNLALKDFLRDDKFLEGVGSNKKIMSIGVPQKLHRKMRVNSSRLSGQVHRNSLIQLCIYRINSFYPDLVYKPLVYNFDLRLFPTKILSNYKKCGFSVSENLGVTIHNNLANFDETCSTTTDNLESFVNPNKFITISDKIVDFIPHLKGDQNYKFNLIQPLNKTKFKENDYSFLTEQQFNNLYRNHSTSFLLEEYLRLVTDLPFDENQYSQYDQLARSDSKVLKFVSNFADPTKIFNQTIENFLNDENLLSDYFTTLRKLVLPKKFDRVFHVLFDPDEFELDSSTPLEVIQKYTSNGNKIEDLTKTEIDEPTFDKYYVLIKSNEGSDAI